MNLKKYFSQHKRLFLFLMMLNISACATSSKDAKMIELQNEKKKAIFDVTADISQYSSENLPARRPSPEAYRNFLLSEILLQKGELHEAIAHVKSAQLSDPNSVFLAVHLAQLLMDAGDLEGAERAAQEALSKNEHKLKALRILAQLRIYSGDYDEAEALFKRGIKENSQHEGIVVDLIQLFVRTEQIEKAQETVEVLMKDHLAAVNGYLMLAQLFAARGEGKNAQKYALLVVEREPQNMEALELLSRLYFAQGKVKEALLWREKWVHEVGDSHETRKKLLSALYLAGNEARANALLKEWLFEDSSENQVRLLAETLSDIGRRDQAIALLKNGQKPIQLAAKSRVELGRLFLLDKNPQKASDYLCGFDDLNTQWTQWVHGLCIQSFLEGGQEDEALALAKEGLQKWPASLAAVSGVLDVLNAIPGPLPDFSEEKITAWCEHKNAQNEDAAWLDLQLRAADFFHGTKGMESLAEAKLYQESKTLSFEKARVLAQHFAKARNVNRVVGLLEKFIERDEATVSDWNFLAYTLATENTRLEDALLLAKRALISRPNAGFVVDTYGWVLFHLERYDEAEIFLRRAEKLSPKEAEIIFHLALVKAQQSKNKEAMFLMKQALSYVFKNKRLRHEIEHWLLMNNPRQTLESSL